jgi:hypothetical protein
MGSVFVAKTRQRDSVETDNQVPQARITFGGVYFFLYPSFLRLRDQTGELVDPQTDAFFDKVTLDELQRCLTESRQRVLAEPNDWEQHVGTWTPTGEPRHERTSQAAVLELLDRLDRAVLRARKEGLGLFFKGE